MRSREKDHSHRRRRRACDRLRRLRARHAGGRRHRHRGQRPERPAERRRAGPGSSAAPPASATWPTSSASMPTSSRGAARLPRPGGRGPPRRVRRARWPRRSASRRQGQGAFEQLHGQREARFAARLAAALGVDADKVQAALDKLKDDPPRPFEDFAQALADELGVDVTDVRARSSRSPPRPWPHAPAPRPAAAPARLRARREPRRPARGAARAAPGAENRFEEHHQALAKFLADRFDLPHVANAPRLPRRRDTVAGRPCGRRPGPATKVFRDRPGYLDHPPAVRGGGRRRSRQALAVLRGRRVHLRGGARADSGRRGGAGGARGREGRPRARHRAQRPALRVPLARGRLPRRHPRGRRPAPDPDRAARAWSGRWSRSSWSPTRSCTSCSPGPGELDGPGPPSTTTRPC